MVMFKMIEYNMNTILINYNKNVLAFIAEQIWKAKFSRVGNL